MSSLGCRQLGLHTMLIESSHMSRHHRVIGYIPLIASQQALRFIQPTIKDRDPRSIHEDIGKKLGL